MKLLLLLSLTVSLYATADLSKIKSVVVNKSQACVVYEESFMTAASLYEDTKSCYDLEYAILSTKQMILTKCDFDEDYLAIAWYHNVLFNRDCKETK
jgi:hypothetical protein